MNVHNNVGMQFTITLTTLKYLMRKKKKAARFYEAIFSVIRHMLSAAPIILRVVNRQ